MKVTKHEHRDYPTGIILESEAEVSYFFLALLLRQYQERYEPVARKICQDNRGIDYTMWSTLNAGFGQ